ncbi:hypothetical protein AHIS1_p056 [Acaryochloris phage A-HIS1]|nr:hypothetical protein AHIS1_p056 [Acaryochloris phage A-HIS1]
MTYEEFLKMIEENTELQEILEGEDDLEFAYDMFMAFESTTTEDLKEIWSNL